jgi:hypothetical protein
MHAIGGCADGAGQADLQQPEIPGGTAAKKIRLRVRKRTEASATVGHICSDAAAQAVPRQDPAMREFIR